MGNLQYGVDKNNKEALAPMSKTVVQLKLLIDSKAKKVIYAEADKQVIDFLFNILSFPIGTVIKLLNKRNMVGSLGNLYESFKTLDNKYLRPDQGKDVLLKPNVSFCGSPNLLPDNYFPTEAKFCTCYESADEDNYCFTISDHPHGICPDCNGSMENDVEFVNPQMGENGGYVKDLVTFMVMDDLSVKPLSIISIMKHLKKFNIKDVEVLEEKIITFDANEGLELLKASMESKTVLTNVFLGETSK